jgi:hypothetical protein
MIIFVVGVVLFIWLVLTFVELPMDNQFNAREYWQDKERKWRGNGS